MVGLAVAGSGWHSAADAAGSQPIGVTVAVLSNSNCTFNGVGNISASIDVAATSPILSAGYFTFRCIGGGPSPVTYAVTNNNGQHGSSPTALALKNTTSSHTIGYSIGYTAAASVSKNTTHTTSLTATFLPTAFQDALPGTYTDTVVFTINP